MKNILNKYLYLSLLFSLSLVFSSCTDDDNFGSDAPKVVPLIFNVTGPTLAFQSSTATYSVGYRGGSEYIWTANNGAEIRPIEGRNNVINVFFKQPGDVTITVYEKAFNGLTSAVKEIKVKVACNPQAGVWKVEMSDDFGDGWQTDDPNGGSGIKVNIDGTIVEIGMCNPYIPSNFACVTGDGYYAETTVTIPVGTISASWNFPGDRYGEISFKIYAPNGTLAFDSGAVGETIKGQLPIVVCN